MHKWLKRPQVVAVMVIALFFGAVAWFYNYNQSPVAGTIYAPTPVPRTQAATITKLTSSTISLEHPAHYAVENKPVTPPMLELYSLKMQQAIESRHITINVKRPLGAETATDDSAYAFRKLKTDEYEASDVVVDDIPAKKMTKKNGTEIVYFIPGPGRYAIIAATSTNPRETFAEEITHIIDSFAWVR